MILPFLFFYITMIYNLLIYYFWTLVEKKSLLHQFFPYQIILSEFIRIRWRTFFCLRDTFLFPCIVPNIKHGRLKNCLKHFYICGIETKDNILSFMRLLKTVHFREKKGKKPTLRIFSLKRISPHRQEIIFLILSLF